MAAISKDILEVSKQPWFPIMMRELGYEQIKHGHWEKRSETDIDGNAWYSCSECEHGDHHAEDVVVPYCWYCGAKMDEVDDDKENTQ